ncbi:MAG: hypothetical protein IJZ46_05740 [Bacilli bacterium]|nr:hypothetical protein [Bacilli bacterium]
MIFIRTGAPGSGKTTYAQNYIKDILGANKNAKINIVNSFKKEYSIFKDNVSFCKSVDDIDSKINYDLIVLEEYHLSETDLSKIEKLSKDTTIIVISQFISDNQMKTFIDMGANIQKCIR